MVQSGDAMTRLAIAEAESPRMHVYDVRSGSNEALEVVSLGHSQPILHMRYNAQHDAVISVDAGGASCSVVAAPSALWRPRA